MVKSADRVIQILEIVGTKERGCTHKELSSTLNIPKSSLTSLLNTLVASNYLSANGDGRRFTLGPQLLVLTGRYLSRLDLVRVGQPVIDRLAAEIDEATEIGVIRDQEVMIIASADCTRLIKRAIQIGERAPLYATAAGKAILAFLPQDQIEQYINSTELTALTPKTITSAARLQRELGQISQKKLAYSREELNEGIIAMAAPIFNIHGLAAASIVVPIPKIRFNRTAEKRISAAVSTAAAKLSYAMGFDAGSTENQYSN